MDAEHHVYLINMLQEVFGSRLCNNCAVETITLDYLWDKKYQVRSLATDFCQPFLRSLNLIFCCNLFTVINIWLSV